MEALRNCVRCGAAFKPYHTVSHLHCSAKCREESLKASRAELRAQRSTVCPECGTAFEQNKVGAPRRFCSDKCKQRVGNRNLRRRQLPLMQPIEKVCPHCGDSFLARSRDRIYCYGKFCVQYAYRRRRDEGQPLRSVPHEVACDGCGTKFIGIHPSARWCSKYCANKYWGGVRARQRRQRSAADYVDREVFIRDDWVCYLCGLPVDPDLDRLHELGATIDHIVPLSRGGSDELSNVALAHWSCNREKRAT